MLLSQATKWFPQGFPARARQGCNSSVLPPLLGIQAAQWFQHLQAKEDTLLGLHGQRQLNLQDTLSSAYRHLKDSANDTKQTIPLTCSTRCNACSSAISMQAAVFVLIHCNEHISHLGPDQHNQPCLATKNWKGRHGFQTLLEYSWKWVHWNTTFSTRVQLILHECGVGRRPLSCSASCQYQKHSNQTAWVSDGFKNLRTYMNILDPSRS